MNKILIIDDDHGYRDDVSIAARKKNWEAYTSPTWRNVQHQIAEKKFSLIIADYRLRNETIIELLDYMKREKIFIPIIVVSADDDEQYKEKALDAGATAFYDKFSLNLSKIYALLDDFQ